MEERTLEIEVDGVCVRGEITYLTAAGIRVEIVEPFTGVSDGWSIPTFARGHVSFKDGDQISERGLKTARSTLADIYRAKRVFERSTESLARTHRRVMRERERDGYIDYQSFLQKRQEYRAQLRAGEIDKKQYDGLLQQLWKQRRAYDSVGHLAVEQVGSQVERTSGITLGHELTEQLVKRCL